MGFAKEIVDVLNTHSFNLYRTIDFYAITITAQALTSNVTWPYVTISSFEIRGDFIEDLSRTSRVGFIPLVSESNRWEWERYTTNHTDWIHQGLLYDDVDSSLLPSLSSIPNHIYHTYVDNITNTATKREVSSSMMHFGNVDYAPVWQLSPVPQDLSIIKYDLFQNDDFRHTYEKMWESGQAEISRIANLTFYLSGKDVADSSHPHSLLLCPVYPYLRNRTRSSEVQIVSTEGYNGGHDSDHDDSENEGKEDNHALEDTDGSVEQEDHESHAHDSDDEYSNDPVGTVMAVFKWQDLLHNILLDGTLPLCPIMMGCKDHLYPLSN
jgi:hypothetical protein